MTPVNIMDTGKLLFLGILAARLQIIFNPPYSANWSAKTGFLSDSRFSDYGVLAPKSKADYAFLLHGFYHLKPTGTMGIVLPHGVLFRGGAEGKIRRKLLENGSIYAVIGLPANLFYNTGIPTCIMILKKQRPGRDVLFIDASKLFEKKKTQNAMNAEHIARVLELYRNRVDVEKDAHLATYEEIKKNDFNLNIPRYVDTFEEEEPVDLAEVNAEIRKIDAGIAEANGKLLSMLGQLRSDDAEIMGKMKEFIKLMGGE